ncbi:50S ribosomal protein L18 [Fundidesulfovibrio magnetotacticus]|uniref:Large ribosomal subunit protein uL18 n=1 Tax=Fundidesulfovibrio magnetotacticus TaxID=2730080 RepID=A0A6V8M0W1_9BACT|nr:50S ribosomal protein L18 [Fundidesulfovibrio magnetotacticus]GFK95646.1 50S ribosomal protein L18 [Fundidesulfovibrio magnetotacticus]
MKLSKQAARMRRKVRIRKKISGSPERPRLVVYRSNLHVYCQIVDDETGQTLVSSSSLALSKGGESLKPNKDTAVKVGRDVAAKAKEKDIASVVFDRNGYLYHGCIKALADGAREGGLQF